MKLFDINQPTETVYISEPMTIDERIMEHTSSKY